MAKILKKRLGTRKWEVIGSLGEVERKRSIVGERFVQFTAHSGSIHVGRATNKNTVLVEKGPIAQT